MEIENYFESDEDSMLEIHTEDLKNCLKQLKILIRRLNQAIITSDVTVKRSVPNLPYKFKIDNDPQMEAISEEDWQASHFEDLGSSDDD